MKRVLSIFFLVIYLASTSEFIQILKIPILVSHYFEHKENKADINFTEFWVIHYGKSTEKHHHKNNTHENLPYHHISLHSNLICDLPKSLDSYSQIRKLFDFQQKIKPTNEQLIQDNLVVSIWQPPKIG